MASSLFEAKTKEDVRIALEFGCDIEKIENNKTALGKACLDGNEEVVRELLEQGADPQNLGMLSLTPIQTAARNGYADIVQLLIDYGVSPNNEEDTNFCWCTPFNLAAARGYVDVINVLIAAGADINLQIGGYVTPLMIAAYTGQIDVVLLLLEKQECDINLENRYGETAIFFAADHGHADIINHLIVNGAKYDKIAEFGNTPLMYGCNKGHLDVVKALVAAGCDLNIENDSNKTAINLAEINGHYEIVEFLVENGAERPKYKWGLYCKSIWKIHNIEERLEGQRSYPPVLYTVQKITHHPRHQIPTPAITPSDSKSFNSNKTNEV